jgi:very-short-patch-repair endonuclease
MTKLEFISRQFKKAENKKFEHYVITRIWHLLNDTRVKFVTQQFVTRPEGRALTDMFFPQLEIHIEVDEGFHKKQIDADQIREADIINATGHQILRIDVTKDIEEINEDIDKIVDLIKTKIEKSPDLKIWDLSAEQNPQTYIERGFIDLKDDVAFRTIVDAVNCFGCNHKEFQLAGKKHPKENGKVIWFPKLYKNDKWNNQISDDENTIVERHEFDQEAKKHIKKIVEKEFHTRIVFARVKSPLGDIMYRFKGEYKLDLEATDDERGLVWKRIGTCVKTYPNN